jgi:hypothetical protein
MEAATITIAAIFTRMSLAESALSTKRASATTNGNPIRKIIVLI